MSVGSKFCMVLVGALLGLGFVDESCDPSAAAIKGPSADDAELSELEAKVLQAVNEYRASKGLPELRVNAKLVEEARKHSRAMAAGKAEFGHDGFEKRLEVAAIPFSKAAENVGQNQGFQDPAARAVADWLSSKGHRANIEGDYDLTGVGVARASDGTFLFTQIFLLESAPDH
jgi:uncharacterized protein YkwD